VPAHRPGGIASSRSAVAEVEDVLLSPTKIHLWVLAGFRGARGRAPSQNSLPAAVSARRKTPILHHPAHPGAEDEDDYEEPFTAYTPTNQPSVDFGTAWSCRLRSMEAATNAKSLRVNHQPMNGINKRIPTAVWMTPRAA
jgi:hypothetical protein